MKVNKYFPFAFVYFFANSLALPFGLTYTAILAPFFYAWILLKRKTEIIFPFVVVLTPFIVVHLFYDDIVRKVYLYSLFNLILVYVFCQAVYTFLKLCHDHERIFRKLLIINFVFCLASMILYFTPWQGLVWIEQDLTEGIRQFRRLKMFTYEASYYATLCVPIFCYYLLQYLLRRNQIRGWILLPMIALPYLLSLSFGVMAVLMVSGVVTFVIHFRTLSTKRRIFNGAIFTGGFSFLAVAGTYLFFRNSFFVLRLLNILSGTDTSAKGRTYDAFFLAGKLLNRGNEFWGIGLGQIKIVGTELLRRYYLYSGDFVAAIPNAAAETLAIFGWVGLALRLLLEILLFFHTRVWSNYYRLWLFLFIFIYQFTGSFITNVAEYVIWIFAFTNVFHEFDARQRNYTASATADSMIRFD